MSKKDGRKSLFELANEVAELYEDEEGKRGINDKTIIRRFYKLIENCGGDVSALKEGKSGIYFQKEEVVFVKYLLLQLAEKNSFIYRTSLKDDLVTLDELHDFVQDLIYHLEAEGYGENEIKAFVSCFDMQIGYSERCLISKCHEYIDCIAENYAQFIYTLKIHLLEELRQKLENETIWSVIEGVKDTIKLMEYKALSKEFEEDGGEEDDEISFEYRKRDSELLEYLNNHPLIREDIEKTTGKKINETFKDALLWLKGGNKNV